MSKLVSLAFVGMALLLGSLAAFYRGHELAAGVLMGIGFTLLAIAVVAEPIQYEKGHRHE